MKAVRLGVGGRAECGHPTGLPLRAAHPWKVRIQSRTQTDKRISITNAKKNPRRLYVCCFFRFGFGRVCACAHSGDKNNQIFQRSFIRPRAYFDLRVWGSIVVLCIVVFF